MNKPEWDYDFNDYLHDIARALQVLALAEMYKEDRGFSSRAVRQLESFLGLRFRNDALQRLYADDWGTRVDPGDAPEP